MTVNDLISFLRKFDGNTKVISSIPATATDIDALGETVILDHIHEDDFVDYNGNLVWDPCGVGNCGLRYAFSDSYTNGGILKDLIKEADHDCK